MNRLAAIIVRDTSAIRFAGLDLVERAERLLRRAGISHIEIVDDHHPFTYAPPAEMLLVVPERVVLEPAAVTDLIERGLADSEDAAVLTDGAGVSTDVVLLSARGFERVRGISRVHCAVRRLWVEGSVRIVYLPQRFIVRLRDVRDVPHVETAYLQHVNGGDGEGLFTRNIRAFSIPLSRRLLAWGFTANQVTLAGFFLSVLAGVSFARGGYRAGVAGALLYFASMVFDCSDGEVARGALLDSKFGAWLETITDYLSYFVVLGGILLGDYRLEGFDHHTAASIVAGTATVAIMALVGYQRARVARVNPGAFDDAVAAELRQGTATQRFAVWGRQLIKRSFVAHLVVFQALIGFIPALTEIWAYGALGALVLVVAVQAHVIRSVRVEPIRAGAL